MCFSDHTLVMLYSLTVLSDSISQISIVSNRIWQLF